VSSVVVVAMDELKTDVASWKCDNESGPRRRTPGWSQDHGEYRVRRRWNPNLFKILHGSHVSSI